MDILNIEILEDGMVKVTTDKVSGANHASADDLLAMLEEELGGVRTTEKRDIKHSPIHHHKHNHIRHRH